jgi:phosphoglycolate phosphatase-like HAD superfamily hydrolase
MYRFQPGASRPASDPVASTPLYYKKMPARPARPAAALALFDIDGTLLRRSGPHHRQVLEDAVRLVTGWDVSTDGIPVHGMLDNGILTEMMERAGVESKRIRRQLPAIIKKAQDLYVRRCPDLRSKVCPGTRAVLARLRRRGVPMGLVTGNLSRIGWTKMRRAGLDGHFGFGAFGEQAPTRADLARRALRQARRGGWIGASASIALIGDHPNDILAARANGIRAIAVATGLSPAAELAAHNPDFLLADLREFRLAMLD